MIGFDPEWGEETQNVKLRLQFPNLRPAEIFDFEGIPLLRSAWFTGVVRAVLVFVALADGML